MALKKLKTINGNALEGTGDIEITGVTSYNDLTDKPILPTLGYNIEQTLVDAETVEWDYSIGNIASVTIGGARTLEINNITSPAFGLLRVTQDSEGGRTIFLPGNNEPDLAFSVGAGEVDLFAFTYINNQYYWSGANYGTDIPDTTAPTLVSASVEDSLRTQILLALSEQLNVNSVPISSDFLVSGGKTISSITISGNQVRINVNTAYANGDVITLDYNPGSTPIEDVAGNNLAVFSNQSVENNISSIDTDAAAYFARLETAGGTLDTTKKQGVSNFITTLKDNGLYAKAVEMYLLSGGVSDAWRLGFKNYRNGLVSGGFTHSQAGGTAGDGTSGYMQTGITKADFISPFSFTVAMDVLTNSSPAVTMTETGIQYVVATPYISSFLRAKTSGNVTFVTATDDYGTTATAATTNSNHRFIGTRTANNSIKLFKDGSLVASNSTTVTDIASSLQYYAWALNNNGAPQQYSNRALSFLGYFEGLTDGEVAILDTAMATLKSILRA